MDKTDHQGELLNYNMGRNISVMIRRPYIYEDAFEKLSLENGRAAPLVESWTGFVVASFLCSLLIGGGSSCFFFGHCLI